MPVSRNTPRAEPTEHNVQVMGVGPDVVADLEDLRDTSDERPEDGAGIYWNEALQLWVYTPVGPALAAHAALWNGHPPHGLGSAMHLDTVLAGLNALISDANVDAAGTPRPPTAHVHAHAATTGQTANDHHNQVHDKFGADHTGMSQFHVNKNAVDQVVGTGAWTLLTCAAEEYDIGGNFDLANNKYIAPANGYYHFDLSVFITSLNIHPMATALYLNGVIWKRGYLLYNGAAGSCHVTFGVDEYLAANDEVTAYVWHNHGANRNVSGNITLTWFSGHRI